MMQNILNWFDTNQMGVILGLLVLAALLSWVLSVVCTRYKSSSKSLHDDWTYAFLNAVYRPALCLIWLLLLFYLMDKANVASSYLINAKFISVSQIISLALLVLWFIFSYAFAVEAILLARDGHSQEHRATIRAIGQVGRILAIIVTLLIVMQTIGLTISALLAFGGVGGVVIGFAARDMLSNFFGGLMIFWDRPFTEGEWIRSPDRSIEGVVEKIGWRLTKVRTFDKRPLYVPNSAFSTIAVENASRMTNRRIKTNVGLRYCDAPKIAVVLADVEKMLKDHDDIDQNQFMMVRLVEFGASSLNFMIYTFTKTTNWGEFQAIQQDVFLKVIEIIDRHGAECAFPTQTLHVPDPVTMHAEKNDS